MLTRDDKSFLFLCLALYMKTQGRYSPFGAEWDAIVILGLVLCITFYIYRAPK